MNIALDNIRPETSDHACAALMRGLAAAFGRLWPLLEELRKRVSYETAAFGQFAGQSLPLAIDRYNPGSVSSWSNEHLPRVSFVSHSCPERARDKFQRCSDTAPRSPDAQLRSGTKRNIMEHIFRTKTGRVVSSSQSEPLRPGTSRTPCPDPSGKDANVSRSWHTSPIAPAVFGDPQPCTPEARSTRVHG